MADGGHLGLIKWPQLCNPLVTQNASKILRKPDNKTTNLKTYHFKHTNDDSGIEHRIIKNSKNQRIIFQNCRSEC